MIPPWFAVRSPVWIILDCGREKYDSNGSIDGEQWGCLCVFLWDRTRAGDSRRKFTAICYFCFPFLAHKNDFWTRCSPYFEKLKFQSALLIPWFHRSSDLDVDHPWFSPILPSLMIIRNFLHGFSSVSVRNFPTDSILSDFVSSLKTSFRSHFIAAIRFHTLGDGF